MANKALYDLALSTVPSLSATMLPLPQCALATLTFSQFLNRPSSLPFEGLALAISQAWKSLPIDRNIAGFLTESRPVLKFHFLRVIFPDN